MDTTTDYIVTDSGLTVVTSVNLDAEDLKDNGVNGNPVVIEICEHGGLFVIFHLVENLGLSCANREYFNAAVRNGHLGLTKYLLQTYDHSIRQKTIEMARNSGNEELVAYLRDWMNRGSS